MTFNIRAEELSAITLCYQAGKDQTCIKCPQEVGLDGDCLQHRRIRFRSKPPDDRGHDLEPLYDGELRDLLNSKYDTEHFKQSLIDAVLTPSKHQILGNLQEPDLISHL